MSNNITVWYENRSAADFAHLGDHCAGSARSMKPMKLIMLVLLPVTSILVYIFRFLHPVEWFLSNLISIFHTLPSQYKYLTYCMVHKLIVSNIVSQLETLYFEILGLHSLFWRIDYILAL